MASFMQRAFYPGRDWPDTSGKPIQAHGGSILQADDACDRYGEWTPDEFDGGGNEQNAAI